MINKIFRAPCVILPYLVCYNNQLNETEHKRFKIVLFQISYKRTNECLIETSWYTSKKKTPAKHLFFLTKAVSEIRGFKMNKVKQLHMMQNDAKSNAKLQTYEQRIVNLNYIYQTKLYKL